MALEQIGIGHPAVKDVLAILRNSAANRFGLVVAEGLWAVRLVLDLGLRVDKFFLCPELLRSDDAQKRSVELNKRARRSFQVSAKTMARMSERGEIDGLLALAEMPVWHPEQLELSSSALVLVPDGIEIPGNLGTLVRTLDACAADALVITNRRTRMSHPKVFRGSQGMSLSVPSLEFEDIDDAIDWLKQQRFTVYLADTSESDSYRNVDYSGRTAIVVGSERYGVSKPWYQHGFVRIGIPMLGRADSLNVSVSASVFSTKREPARPAGDTGPTSSGARQPQVGHTCSAPFRRHRRRISSTHPGRMAGSRASLPLLQRLKRQLPVV